MSASRCLSSLHRRKNMGVSEAQIGCEAKTELWKDFIRNQTPDPAQNADVINARARI